MPHAHASAAAAHRNRLVMVLGLSVVILVVEAAGAYASNSLALLADAGHMLTDVSGISLALLAIWFAGRAPTRDRTFGYLRLEILAAVANAVLLFGVAAFILYEAWQRLTAPPDVASGLMLAIALVGLGANAVSLVLLRDAQRDSLNMRGAYLEVLGDFLGSGAVIIAAIVIGATGWTQADAVASIVIALLILPRTFALLREATDVLLEATPKGIDMDHIRQHILDAPGVIDCHDLHAWTITSGMNVVSAHVIVADGADPAVTLGALCECLSDDFDIEHSTFQLETADRRRFEERSHA
ncbi:MAG TPA: cation diffusion facilitator family transporter [Candidatus Limnocylindrales bacterium]|nr:cation diffusion facilitator family transporter [Candidatus Limnocylindrales bacterium]